MDVQEAEVAETRSAITLERLMDMSQDELDDAFRNADAGDIPDGEGEGTAIVGKSTVFKRCLSKFVRWFLWQGKVFSAAKGTLVNRVSVVGVKAIKAEVYKAPSWLDGQLCVVLDYSKTSLVARKIRDEIREVAPGLYLGKVYWGRKRLIDFAVEFPHAKKKAMTAGG